MSEFLELKQVVSALVGAVLALLGQALIRKGTRARTARKLCIAFWEELKAVNFYGPADKPNFAGFSSQTFDSLFKEIADTLPESLACALMRYHWRPREADGVVHGSALTGYPQIGFAADDHSEKHPAVRQPGDTHPLRNLMRDFGQDGLFSRGRTR
jgi:hypothetical protein